MAKDFDFEAQASRAVLRMVRGEISAAQMNDHIAQLMNKCRAVAGGICQVHGQQITECKEQGLV